MLNFWTKEKNDEEKIDINKFSIFNWFKGRNKISKDENSQKNQFPNNPSGEEIKIRTIKQFSNDEEMLNILRYHSQPVYLICLNK